MDVFLIASDPDQIDSERRKAKTLKRSAWWKNRLGQGMCDYCKKRFSPNKLTMDHKMPLIRGGRSTKGNCVPACEQCNRDKQNLPAEVWRTMLESYSEESSK